MESDRVADCFGGATVVDEAKNQPNKRHKSTKNEVTLLTLGLLKSVTLSGSVSKKDIVISVEPILPFLYVLGRHPFSLCSHRSVCVLISWDSRNY